MIRIVKELLINAAEKNAEKIGVIHKNEEYRYDTILYKSECLASILVEFGIKKGDRVCFFLEKRIEKIISIFGITIAGAIFVPIKRLLNNIQVVHILNDCNAKVLVTTASRVPNVLKNRDILNDLETIIYIGHSIKGFNDVRIRCVEWDKVFENVNIALCKYPSINQYDIATVLYTSGSTGNAKGVVLSHKNIVEGAKVVSEYLEINNNDKILSILSFGFDYGLNQLTSAFLNVAQLIMLDYLFAKDIINEIYRSKITGLAAVSATWIRLLQEDWDENKTKSLRYITNSGGAIPEKYVIELRKKLRNAKIFLMYGLTEAFRSTYLEPSLIDKYPTSIGKAIPGEEIYLLDENKNKVECGQIGEIVHRGCLVSMGYWKDKDATNIRFKRNPLQINNVVIDETVVFTGDYAYQNEDGNLFYIGRKDEMIKCSGNRISPTEVEDILIGLKSIINVVVFGIPNDIYGETVYAVVEIKKDIKVDEDEIKRYCNKTMPKFMVPEKIDIWDKLPLNASGKLDRSGIKKIVFKMLGIEKKLI